MTKEKILVVEDEKDIAKLLRYNLEKGGYRVETAFDGEAGLALFRSFKPDLAILDIMLPKMDGFELCKAIRGFSRTPIIMLTARTEVVDRVLGLEFGADDYVTKPFSIREVLARVKVILRRASGAEADVSAPVRMGDLEVDLERYTAHLKGKPLTLSSKEFEFLKCLILSRGRALTRDQILEKVWGYDESAEIDTRTVDQHIARLREKLGPEAGRIVTVKNVGYRADLEK